MNKQKLSQSDLYYTRIIIMPPKLESEVAVAVGSASGSHGATGTGSGLRTKQLFVCAHTHSVL